MRLILTLALTATVALSTTSSALAQSPGFAGGLTAPSSAQASLGFHLPLGGSSQQPARASYGASLDYRAGGESLTQSASTPATSLAAVNFSGGQIDEARIGGLDFSPSGQTAPQGSRLGLFDSDSIVPILLTVAIVAVGFLAVAGNGSDHRIH